MVKIYSGKDKNFLKQKKEVCVTASFNEQVQEEAHEKVSYPIILILKSPFLHPT